MSDDEKDVGDQDSSYLYQVECRCSVCASPLIFTKTTSADTRLGGERSGLQSPHPGHGSTHPQPQNLQKL